MDRQPTSGKFRKLLANFREIYEGLFFAPYRAQVHREYLAHRDVFITLNTTDWLGIPNPNALYTLELYPFLIGEYHEWHRRLGHDHAPEGGFRCC